MNTFNAAIMGLIQALTEYLPISSSAHLRIYGALIGSDPGAAFTAIIQFGTQAAVILYFRKDIKRILVGWFGALFGRDGKDWRSRFGAHNRDAKLGWYIILATIPIVIAGLLFKDQISSAFRNLWLTVAMLVIFGIILWMVDARSKQFRDIDDLDAKHSLLYGLGQILSLIPGVSRSGSTITVGRALGYSRESAARISFLMSIPSVVGASLYETYDALKHSGDATAAATATQFPGWGATLLATLIAFVVGYFVVIIFLKIVSTFSYKGFAVYRIIIAVIIALLLMTGVLSPNAGGSLAG
jgi:undecaprenyl-diphosphatase